MNVINVTHGVGEQFSTRNAKGSALSEVHPENDKAVHEIESTK